MGTRGGEATSSAVQGGCSDSRLGRGVVDGIGGPRDRWVRTPSSSLSSLLAAGLSTLWKDDVDMLLLLLLVSRSM